MSDTVTNDAFKDTASQAIEMLGKLEADVTPPVTSATTTLEAVETATPVEAPEPPILDVSPETRVRIKVDGEEKTVSAKEYTEILQRTDVFTQRQQALARQRQELEQHYTQREAELQQRALQLQQHFSQPQEDPIQRLVQELQKTQQAPQLDPNDIATIGEVQKAMAALYQQQQAELAQMQQRTQGEIQAAQEHARQEYALAQDQKRITETVKTILNSEDGKLLRELNPQAEAIIRYNALQMGPQNIDQAVEFLNQYASGWAEKVKGKFAHQTTAHAVSAAKTVMEPPGGTPPGLSQQPKVVALKKDGSVDWNALRERALSMLE